MIKQILQRGGDNLAGKLRKNLSEKRVNASGNLSRSIMATATEESFGYRLIIDAFAYIFATEDGRGPTRKDQGGILRKKIFQWTKDKGISAASEKERWAITDAILWNPKTGIHKKGTALHQKGGNSGVLSDVINPKAVREIEKALANQIEIESIEGIVRNSGINGTTNI